MTKDEVIDLIKDTGLAMVSTVEGNEPRVRPMMPYLAEDGNFIIATFKGKRVVKQIQDNPAIELCFLDRQMNFARVKGTATISDDADKKQLIWDNAPMLRQYFSGPEDENMTVVAIDSGEVEAMTPQHQQPDVLSLK